MIILGVAVRRLLRFLAGIKRYGLLPSLLSSVVNIQYRLKTIPTMLFPFSCLSLAATLLAPVYSTKSHRCIAAI